MKKRSIVPSKVVIFLILILLVASAAFAVRLPKIFSFSQTSALQRWQERVFKGRVLYTVNVDEGGGYLTAYSQQAASGIFYRMSFNPRKKPMVSWKWKVVRFPDKGWVQERKEGWIEKDDYAARFYVIFPGIVFRGTKCLEYVWDKDLPKELILTSPYFENIKIIVAESGTKNVGKWVQVERNIRQDFRKAFGQEPSGRVGAVAIMTDADNTLSTAEAWYDEIRVGYNNEK